MFDYRRTAEDFNRYQGGINMTFSQTVLSIIEVLAVVLTIIALINENRIARFERRIAKKALRFVVRRYRAHKRAKSRRIISESNKSVYVSHSSEEYRTAA